MPNALSISGKKNPTLTIATRGSTLALWQANWVREKILEQHTELNVELLTITTAGDRNQQQPLAEIGGKGLFVKDLENALLEGRADLAVHSMKDVTSIRNSHRSCDFFRNIFNENQIDLKFLKIIK